MTRGHGAASREGPTEPAARKALPLIGVTCDLLPARGETKLTAYERYVTSLRNAGALAVLLPPITAEADAHLDLVDGLLFTGGDDLDPTLWGGVPGPTYLPSDPRRTEYELALVMGAIERDTPMLGICLGLQLLNVACGGSLRADLPIGDVRHIDAELGLALRHDVDVMKGSVLAGAMGIPGGGRLSVNSSHNNAPDGLGERLRASALSLDGLIEAVEHREQRFCVGVQWHVEADVAAHEPARRLFAAFADACAVRGRKR